jgi:hypothetical protein
MALYGKGSQVEGVEDMMKRGEVTPQKRQKATTKTKMRTRRTKRNRQECRIYSNLRQSGNERYVRVIWDGSNKTYK